MTAHRVAIVTGAASGVGAATALLLARRGYAVLLNYNRRVSSMAMVLAALEFMLDGLNKRIVFLVANIGKIRITVIG